MPSSRSCEKSLEAGASSRESASRSCSFLFHAAKQLAGRRPESAGQLHEVQYRDVELPRLDLRHVGAMNAALEADTFLGHPGSGSRDPHICAKSEQ